MAGLQDMAAMQGGPPPEAGAPMGPPQEGGGDERQPMSVNEELDADIAFGMMAAMLYSEKGEQAVRNALGAQNPAPSLGLIISTLMEKITTNLAQRGVEINDSAWLAEGGAVDRFLDEIADMVGKEAKFDEQLQSMVFAEVIDQLKVAAHSSKGAGAPPPAGGPPMGPPPGDPMMMGGA